MSVTSLPPYQQIAQELSQDAISMSPAELHGLIVGMLCGGVDPKSSTWQALLFDYTNDGMGWPMASLNYATSLFSFSGEELAKGSFELSMLLSDDGELMAFADSVSEWVNHFISGVGLASSERKSFSADVKEALGDLEEIGKLGIDEEDDLEEQADLLEQVLEHVKACVLTVHVELTKPAPKAGGNAKPTLH